MKRLLLTLATAALLACPISSASAAGPVKNHGAAGKAFQGANFAGQHHGNGHHHANGRPHTHQPFGFNGNGRGYQNGFGSYGVPVIGYRTEGVGFGFGGYGGYGGYGYGGYPVYGNPANSFAPAGAFGFGPGAIFGW